MVHLFLNIQTTFSVTVHVRIVVGVLIPDASVLVCIAQTIQMTRFRSIRARKFVPGTGFFVCVLKTWKMIVLCSVSTRPFVPITTVLMQVDETWQVTVHCRITGCPFVPCMTTLVQCAKFIQISLFGSPICFLRIHDLFKTRIRGACICKPFSTSCLVSSVHLKKHVSLLL